MYYISLWILWSGLLQTSVETQPKGIEMRLLISAWLLFSLVVVSSYTATLTVFLGLKQKLKPFANLKEVRISLFCNYEKQPEIQL